MASTQNAADHGATAPADSPFKELFARKTTVRPANLPETEVPLTGRTVGYSRVSRTDQNLDRQIDALRDAGCTDFYSDRYSGASLKRPQFQKMCYSLQPGDTVIVTHLDRLGRSVIDTLRITNAFAEHGVRFVVLNLGMDTATSQGKLMLIMLAALAELERDFLIERTQAGLAAARARGRTGGRKEAVTREKARLLIKWRLEKAESVETAAAIAKVAPRTAYRFFADKREADERGDNAFYDKYRLPRDGSSGLDRDPADDAEVVDLDGDLDDVDYEAS